ncbi:TIGR03621 family F420-dependent LLM class oxidoreductase [Nocardia uniformis]|uniref:TIGR03621 family F420-dependent LLM class oxidoreductase n=1 Tax=Nocardia uniformis TaxID=53432 RepID=A0A849BZK0_9NOCA|nr:TIGR03621 family F420-dependent LLM class oxidoreductase [Nocardia uniformis]NNH69077.1 TIGR03621 family F420-dependent LLM class oxidoreductase [Nocardia uniformis]
MTKPFRFGVNLTAPGSRTAWVTKCRRAEELGYDVVAVPDHLGLSAPFPALMLAGEVTERVRLNTFVLNTPFYNPVLLARDIAGLDSLTDGRVELGLGAGYVGAEFEAAGMPFPSAGKRVDHLEETVTTLRKLFADPEYQPQPAQPGGPPLLIAGWGDRVLRLAAEQADVVAFTGGGRPILADAAGVAQKTDYVRGLLGNRSVEFNLLIQQLAAPEQRSELAAALAPHLQSGSDAVIEDIPTLLVGTPTQMAETLRERREQYGFSYITVLEPNLEKFAPVLELLAGQ